VRDLKVHVSTTAWDSGTLRELQYLLHEVHIEPSAFTVLTRLTALHSSLFPRLAEQLGTNSEAKTLRCSRPNPYLWVIYFLSSGES
jgi:hypothetical protein